MMVDGLSWRSLPRRSTVHAISVDKIWAQLDTFMSLCIDSIIISRILQTNPIISFTSYFDV